MAQLGVVAGIQGSTDGKNTARFSLSTPAGWAMVWFFLAVGFIILTFLAL